MTPKIVSAILAQAAKDTDGLQWIEDGDDRLTECNALADELDRLGPWLREYGLRTKDHSRTKADPAIH